MPQQQAPYGDIFLVNTPALDRTAAQMYQEQKTREAKQAQENQLLDAGMQKEFGKVRAVDTPAVIDKYQKYRELKKKLLFNKDIQKDPKLYNQTQQKANEALADAYGTINKSAELNAQGKQLVTERMKNPNLFADNFGDMISEFQKTPLDQIQNHKTYGDLSNPDNYRYKGSNTDWQKVENAAAGTPKPTFSKEEPVGTLQFKQTPYSFGNTPAQYYQNFLGSLGTHQASRDAEHAWDALTPDQKDYINKAYSEITPEKWQRMTGSLNPQQLIPTNPDSKAEQLAILKAKAYAINNEPKEGTPIYRDNKEAETGLKFKNERVMEGIKQANRIQMLNLHEDAKKAGASTENAWIDKHIDDLVSDAEKNAPAEYKYKGGKKVYEHDIPVDPVLSKALTKSGVAPTYLRVTSDGMFRPIYLQHDKNGAPLGDKGRNAVDDELSKPITQSQLKLALGYKSATGKQRVTEMLHTEPAAPKKAAKVEDLKKLYGIEY